MQAKLILSVQQRKEGKHDMPRFFNTAGPCRPDIHYMLSATSRLPDIERLIEQENYFVIHAPRQTGKSTAMLTLGQQLTQQGHYTAVMVSAEVGAPFPHDPGQAELAILSSWRGATRARLPEALRPPEWPTAEAGGRIRTALQAWAEVSPRPLVIFIDEIDALRDEALVSVLRQLRDGFPDRPHGFPKSIGLIGLRDVWDYKFASGGSDRLNTASPFNIKARSFTLRNFTHAEVAELYAQHTEATGQIFTPEAVQLAFDLTKGQPWLVNALAQEVVEEVSTDLGVPLTPEDFQIAKETLIVRKDTHLDSLAERLKEPRIKVILEPMLAGQELVNVPEEDIQFVLDLGLCIFDTQGGLVIANPIYREILLRVLTIPSSASLPQIAPTWLTPTGDLDPEALLQAFLRFWLQHGEPLLKSAPYHEIAPHLVLMAFLHRVVNGGGTLEREYAIGRDRMDLCLRYGSVTLGIELKVQRGLEQIDGYLARLGLASGWLVIFDRRQGVPELEDRLRTEVHTTAQKRRITVVFA
jgi:hypothetical protein